MSAGDLRRMKGYEALRTLGLSDYEAQAYLALVAHGPLSAKEVSERTGIPYTKVYEVLRKLEDRGWVDSVEAKPRIYRARPPSQVADVVARELMEKLGTAVRTLKDELQRLYEAKSSEGSGIKMVKGEEDARKLALEALATAKEVVVGTLPQELYRELTSTLDYISEKGVEVKVKVEREKGFPLGLLIVDYRAVFVSFHVRVAEGFTKTVAVYAVDDVLAGIALEWLASAERREKHVINRLRGK